MARIGHLDDLARARRIVQVNDARVTGGLIQLTDAAGPVLLRTCRYADQHQGGGRQSRGHHNA